MFINSPAGNSGNIIDRLLDVNKHLTTLSAGALVLLSTFLTDVFGGDLDTFTSLALGTAFLSLISATVMAALNLVRLAASEDSSDELVDRARTYTRLVGLFFTIGITTFATAAYFDITNLF